MKYEIERTALEEQVSACCRIMIDLNMTSCDWQSVKWRNLPTVTESPRILHYQCPFIVIIRSPLMVAIKED